MSWFRSYIINSYQVNRVNGVLSGEERVKCGVPGALYSVVSSESTCAAISVRAVSVEDLENKLNTRLAETSKWMTRNKLTLNLKKTSCMVFGTSHTLSIVNQNPPGIVNMLDPQLTFVKHAEYTRSECVGRLYMQDKRRKFIDSETALTLYKSLIVPIMDYGDVYYCLSAKDTYKIQKLQNSAL